MIWDEKTDFPKDNWYLKIDDENRELVNNWRINIIKYSTVPCAYPYIDWMGSGWMGSSIWRAEDGSGWFGMVLITTEQFKKYVLLEKEQENYNYLIPFLKKLNIK